MQENYVQIMLESLKKKETILNTISEKNLEQKAIVEKEDLSFEEFDRIIEEKAEQLTHDLLATLEAPAAPEFTGDIDLDGVKIAVTLKRK